MLLYPMSTGYLANVLYRQQAVLFQVREQTPSRSLAAESTAGLVPKYSYWDLGICTCGHCTEAERAADMPRTLIYYIKSSQATK
jgi:hypothetical protein